MNYSMHCTNASNGLPDKTFTITDLEDGIALASLPATYAYSPRIDELDGIQDSYVEASTGRPATGYRWFSDDPALISHLGYIKPSGVSEYQDPHTTQIISLSDYARLQEGKITFEELQSTGKVYKVHASPLEATESHLRDYLMFRNTQLAPHNQMPLIVTS